MKSEQLETLNNALKAIVIAVDSATKVIDIIAKDLKLDELGESIKQGEINMHACQAQHVVALPVVAQPVVAQPVVAQPVVAQPGFVVATVEQVDALCRAKLAEGLTGDQIVATIQQHGADTISKIPPENMGALLSAVSLLRA
jgi:hypothetical protein